MCTRKKIKIFMEIKKFYFIYFKYNIVLKGTSMILKFENMHGSRN